jgi:transposase
MTREQKIAKARRLKVRGLSYGEVAMKVGVCKGTVRRWLNPEEAARNRAASREWKRRNPDKTSAYDREYAETHKKACSQCGGPLIHDAKTEICMECRMDNRDFKYRQLERLWAEGKTYPEIQEEMGWTRDYLAVTMDRARDMGYHLPYRYTKGKRGGSKFPEQVAA